MNESTHEELIKELAIFQSGLSPHDANFAASMIKQWTEHGRLSEKQWYWVNRLLGRSKPAAESKESFVLQGNASVLFKMFAAAQQHLRYPKLYLQTEPYAVRCQCNRCGYELPLQQRCNDESIEALLQRVPSRIPCPTGDGGILEPHAIGYPVRLHVAGPQSKYCGSVVITNGGSYDTSMWYGVLHKSGEWYRPVSVRERYELPAIHQMLEALLQNPLEFAQRHGKLHGNCCFCGKPLDHPTSVKLGYGPTCAKHFGLQWN